MLCKVLRVLKRKNVLNLYNKKYNIAIVIDIKYVITNSKLQNVNKQIILKNVITNELN